MSGTGATATHARAVRERSQAWTASVAPAEWPTTTKISRVSASNSSAAATSSSGPGHVATSRGRYSIRATSKPRSRKKGTRLVVCVFARSHFRFQKPPWTTAIVALAPPGAAYISTSCAGSSP